MIDVAVVVALDVCYVSTTGYLSAVYWYGRWHWVRVAPWYRHDAGARILDSCCLVSSVSVPSLLFSLSF